MDDKTLQRHRDNVRRMKQERRRTPAWQEKRRQTFENAQPRIALDPANRSWYYDGDGTKRDKETDEVVE